MDRYLHFGWSIVDYLHRWRESGRLVTPSSPHMDWKSAGMCAVLVVARQTIISRPVGINGVHRFSTHSSRAALPIKNNDSGQYHVSRQTILDRVVARVIPISTTHRGLEPLRPIYTMLVGSDATHTRIIETRQDRGINLSAAGIPTNAAYSKYRELKI